ncbi:MAG TPA: GAF domain-containing SpoIIE family protein phosphatase [Chthoniobacteraceae bacterium]|jgi:sigma-B regulation protein RsbU (phosphoserine phosphatase)|nr:GAF domain-containing SpoIIE family protein phosphatase [Chthoniobacteraceae bacterium]
MAVAILSVLLVASSVTFFIVYRRLQRRIEELDEARVRIEQEETRVFDFLHGMGITLSETTRPADLHARIVNGALEVLRGPAGALYLSPEASGTLRPAFISKECPPFFEIPDKTRAEGGKSFQLHSYLRLRSLKPGEGVIGAVWREREPILLSGNDSRLEWARRENPGLTSAMLAPLLHGDGVLGVLLVCRLGPGEPFTLADFATFKAIAEQSAFALSTAVLFSDAAEKRRMDEDLQVAYEIQRILLPTNAPDVAGFQLAGINIPARQVSGDYYDYVPVDEAHCGVAIADVSGKGIPASLIMAMCRSVLRSHALNQTSPAVVLRRVNEQIYPDIKEDMFISMAYAILEKDSSTVTLSRAGHDAPLHYSKRRHTITKVNPPGMAIGIDSGGVFNRVTGDFSLTLEPDDCLILYTDGVTEALNSEGDEFGMERLMQSILTNAADGAAGIISRLTDDWRHFIGAYPQNDDVTLIVIRKK